jgi:nucleotide-binding universal stress UspA family protein
MNTVLAAIDFSAVSRKVITTAMEIARAVHGRAVILNAVQPPSVVTDLAPLVGEALQFTADIERASRRHLHRIGERFTGRGVSVETICRQGFPTSLIIAAAKEVEARYIVLGSHGHTAFYDLAVGSTASGVLKRAPCPVIVVTAPAKPNRRKSRRK